MNNAVVLNLKIADISVGERRRDDLGRIDDLAASIQTYGLLHPIVVDDANNLIAGGRRLAAVTMLGWETIPVRLLGTLTDAERREIELEENLQRKDLTLSELDKSMGIVELAEIAAEVLTETRSNLEQVSGKRGPDPKPDSIRRVAERIGVAPSEITRARQHIAAVAAHPELKDEPQSTALDYAKAVKQEPELQGATVSSVVNHYRTTMRRPVSDEETIAYRAQRRAMREEREREEAEADAQEQMVEERADVDGVFARNRMRADYRRQLDAAAEFFALKPEAFIPLIADADRTHLDAFVLIIRKWCDRVEALRRPHLQIVGGERHVEIR